jgi:hypothetical protein
MITSKLIHSIAVIAFLISASFLSGCQSQGKPAFSHNIPPLENALIDSINNDGPGDRYVINKVNVSDEVVDWFTISLTYGSDYSALSDSGSGMVGAGSVVQICGRGDFLGLSIFTEYPYLCQRGKGLIFGVTKHGWVHLYGTGEISGTRISFKKPG